MPAIHAKLASIAVVLPALAGCVGQPAPADLTATTAEGPLREFEFFVKAGTLEPRPGVEVFALGFVADPADEVRVPGPEIRVREGDRVRVTLHADRHTIHWHGLSVPWAMDGVPYMTQGLPAEDGTPDHVYVYDFVARETGAYWYHCHVDAPVHVDLGMFGAFIVEPRDRAADPAFDREATLFLHEYDRRSFAAFDSVAPVLTGQPPDPSRLGSAPQNPAELPGFLAQNTHASLDALGADVGGTGVYAFGSAGPRDHYPLASTRYRPHYDLFMVNGKEFPHTEPVTFRTGETLRLRLVNAGQLVHTVHLHGHHGLVTHKDGYPLASPYWVDTLGMFPGERYDVYVEGTNPGVWDLHDHGGAWGVGAYATTDGAFPGGMNTMLVYEDFAAARLPEPQPGERRTSADYLPWAPSYRGVAPADR